MNCPQCGADAEIGLLEARTPVAGLLFLAAPLLGLNAPAQVWWTSDEGDRELVLEVREAAQGYLCRRCGTLVVPPERG